MSKRYPGGFIMKNPTAPTGGEYGTAPGVWTLDQVMNYQRAGTWPSPLTPKMLWSWGDNSAGQLGQGNRTSTSFPTIVGSDANWKNVAGSSTNFPFTLFVKTDGTLWASGANNNGQLGKNDTVSRSSPVQVGALTNWSNVKTGYACSIGLKTDGTLWSWGFNGSGELGLGDKVDRSSPVQVGSLSNWASISSGVEFVSATKTDGTLWAWGYNGQGQLGQNDAGLSAKRSSPVQVGALTNWSKVACGGEFVTSVKTDGSLWAWGKGQQGQVPDGGGFDRSSPVQIGSLTNWSKIANCGSSGFSIKTDGTLWSWGKNNYGQSGRNIAGSNVLSPNQVGALTNWSGIYAGAESAFATQTNNTLWSWGNNSNGQLGNGTFVNKSSPVQIGSNISWNKATGSVTSISTYFALATGKPLSLELWGWGYNGQGQLGQNNKINRSSPVQVGSDIDWLSISIANNSMVAIKSNGTLWAWGYNSYGQLGTNDKVARSSPVQVGSLTTWKQVSGGSLCTFATKTDGTLWSWGRNNVGQLAQNDTIYRSSPVQIGALTTWSSVIGLGLGAFALKTDGSLWAWGYNYFGQLGQNNTISRSSPVQVGLLNVWRNISGGTTHVISTRSDGTLWSWGYNISGQLGQNNTINKSSPTQIGALTNWANVSASNSRLSVATKSDGTLWSWGGNNAGQLGIGNTVYKSSPTQIGSLTTWSKISASGYACFATTTSGSLWAWGSNNNGALGTNNLIYTSSPVQIGSETNWNNVISDRFASACSTFALKQNSSIQPAITSQPTGGSVTEEGSFTFTVTATGAWGYQWYFAGAPIAGATSYSYTVTGATSANAGDYYVVVYNGNGSVTSNTVSLTVTVIQGGLWSWGGNSSGQLGLSNTTGYSSPKQVGAGTTWSVVAGTTDGSEGFSLSVKTDGTLWSWGKNDNGQLGQGNTTYYSSPKQVGALTTWAKVANGLKHGLAIKTDGTLWSWGNNDEGQLGKGNTTSYSSPKQIGALTTWAKVFCGSFSSIAIKTDGTLWTWGNNSSGQLGQGNTISRSSPIQVGALTNWSIVYSNGNSAASFCLSIKTDNTLWAWGSNNHGQLGRGNTTTHLSSPVQVGSLTNWSKVSCLQYSAVSTKTDGTLWTWGRNNNGQLGLGNTTNYSSPKQVGALTTWSKTSGCGSTCHVIKTDGTLWTWGGNTLGTFGNGTTSNSYSPVQVGSSTNWSRLSTSGTGGGFKLAIRT